MKTERNVRLAGSLMGISILLLVLFQAYWLRQTYRDEFTSLRRELSLIFRETTLRRQFNRLISDSARTSVILRRDNSERPMVAVFEGRIDTMSAAKSPENNRMQVVVRTDTVAINNAPRRMFAFESDRRDNPYGNTRELKVIAPLPFPGSNIDSMNVAYRKALEDNDIQLSFSLQKTTREHLDSLLHTDTSYRRNNSRYNSFLSSDLVEANFENPFWVIVPKMIWPIVFAFIMILITITAFVFLYRNLRAQHRLAAIKNEFISNITHELKTPIATVGVAIEALKNFNAINDPSRTKEYLEISASELHRLSLLVDKVLKLSMFEQHAMTMQFAAVDLKALVMEVVDSMKLQIERAGVQLQVEAPNNQYVVNGDRTHLLSVIYNLLDNAIKYSPQKPQVHISIQQSVDGTRLTVQDNGIGIAAPYREKVFDKFFRVPHGDTHNIKGYGLGLSYVAEVVKLHRGNITIANATPIGTIFTVTIPA